MSATAITTYMSSNLQKSYISRKISVLYLKIADDRGHKLISKKVKSNQFLASFTDPLLQDVA